jgi:predicted double-glycine peptidase
VRRTPERPVAQLSLVRIGQFLVVAWGTIALTTTGLSAQIGIGPSGLRAERSSRSMKDLRDQNLVKQRFDFSCGAAALATILRYGFGDDITEQQILIDLFTQLSDEERKTAERMGFSLLDLQRVAQRRGYAAEGFRLTSAQLSMLAGPVIVFIEPRGYKHFAVLRGVRGDRVYLADPSRGNIRQPLYTFLDDWVQDGGTGIIFVVEPKTSTPDANALRALRVPATLRQPEIIAARELLTIGAPLLQLPHSAR